MFRRRTTTTETTATTATRIPVKSRRVHRKRHRIRKVAIAAAGAIQAQQHLKEDLKAAGDSYKRSVTSGIPLYAGAGLLALGAGVVLTVGIVVLLNNLLGSPWGYFATVVAYLAIAGGMVFAAGRAREHHKEEAREHVEDAREDVRDVTRPMKAAFGDGE